MIRLTILVTDTTAPVLQQGRGLLIITIIDINEQPPVRFSVFPFSFLPSITFPPFTFFSFCCDFSGQPDFDLLFVRVNLAIKMKSRVFLRRLGNIALHGSLMSIKTHFLFPCATFFQFPFFPEGEWKLVP